jgi:hypothetical protein
VFHFGFVFVTACHVCLGCLTLPVCGHVSRLLPLIIEHTIDERSPLCGHTHDTLAEVRDVWSENRRSVNERFPKFGFNVCRIHSSSGQVDLCPARVNKHRSLPTKVQCVNHANSTLFLPPHSKECSTSMSACHHK